MLSAITLTAATPRSTSELSGGVARLAELRAVVEERGATALPGCGIKYASFMECMWQAVGRGFVRHEDAVFAQQGLRYGFKAGIDVTRMLGHKWYKNYKSALEGREAVTRATMKRVQAGKTIPLGTWTNTLASGLKSLYKASAIFPVGAVPKALEPGEVRPTSDHSATGLNSATDLDGLRHTLNAYEEIAWFLELDYCMRMSDVEAAFPMLPLHPDVWPFFLFRFYAGPEDTEMSLFANIFGDFGAAGMPGTFKRFFVDVVVNMARSVRVLTLPMPVYVDDCALIGPCPAAVDAEMEAFHGWAWDVCGVAFKVIKDRLAATRQLALGFWWDSTTLTRELEEKKLLQYLDMLAEFAVRDKLTLREMQSCAGRMQRAIMTLPPGAGWMLVPLFAMMCGLKLPWHRRRTTRQVRDNFLYCGQLLKAAMGRGYYSYANFRSAPPVWTDASKSKAYTGGGFVSACGRYDFWQYGAKAQRKFIDYLEGDTVTVACQRLAHLWRGCVVSLYCDNKSFQASAAKGRSKAERLNSLVQELFLLMIKYDFILHVIWISTNDNVNADALSRVDGEEKFLREVYKPEHACWSPDTVPIRLDGAGRKRTLPEKRGVIDSGERAGLPVPESKSASEEGDGPAAAPPASLDVSSATLIENSRPVAGDDGTDYIRRAQAAGGCPTAPAAPVAPRRGAGIGIRRGGSLALVLALFGCFCVPGGDCMPVTRIQASMSYSPASLYAGLPLDLVPQVETVLDNRLASSSWRKVQAAVKIWRAVADVRGWPHIIATDDPDRGGKLVTFVLHMLTDTDLVWGSVQTYVWGVRTWVQSQHQADPVMGVRSWDIFMDGVKVLAWVPAEPRRRCPVDVVDRILDAVSLDSFLEVQLAFIILCLLYTFSRTECPCPKAFSGREVYDPEVHWNVCDFDVAITALVRVLRIRFRVIKQDQRVERPEARGDGDWAVVGDVPNSKWSPLLWYTRLQRFHGRRADPRGPMFLDPDRQRPLLYSKLREQFRRAQLNVGVPEAELAGPHGLRVEGYNATKNGLGAPLAVAQGGWKSSAHERYDRFSMDRVVRIPAVIAGVDEGDDPAPLNEAGERPAGPPQRRLRRADVAPRRASLQEEEGTGAGGSDADDESEEPRAGAGAGEAPVPPREAGRGGSPGRSGPGPLLSLTPGGSAAPPAGYWGEAGSRPPPRRRAQSPPRRRSPSSSRE